jgi:hypothetical protein
MPADLADNAAALAEGYVRIQLDRGVGTSPRYFSRYEKPIDTDSMSGCLRVIQGRGDDASQANADTNALASLNAVRRYVYGTDATNVNKGAKTGTALTVGRY